MTRHISHIAPVADIASIYDAPSIAAEVAEMECLVVLLRRRAELTLELAEQGVDWAARELSPEKIKAMVAKRRGVSVGDMEGLGCTRMLVEARHEAMFLMRNLRDERGDPVMSFVAIGHEFGGRDHTSVCNGVAKHRARLAASLGVAERAAR